MSIRRIYKLIEIPDPGQDVDVVGEPAQQGHGGDGKDCMFLAREEQPCKSGKKMNGCSALSCAAPSPHVFSPGGNGTGPKMSIKRNSMRVSGK